MVRFNTFALILIFLLSLPLNAIAEVQLKFGVYTADKASEMVRQFRPVLNALEQKMSERLKEPVSISMKVAATYEQGIDAIANGEVDIAQLGPVSYVEAYNKNPKITILAIETEKGKKEFNGVIAVHKDSPIKSISELRGKSFAFGDQYSTIGRYLSQQLLYQNGIRASDLSKYEYLDRHDKVGLAVAAGRFDAGALKEGTFKKLVAAGNPLRELVTFPNVTKPWIARAGLPDHIVTALREGLLAIDDKAALEALGQDGFTAGTDSDYNTTREAMKVSELFSPAA